MAAQTIPTASSSSGTFSTLGQYEQHNAIVKCVTYNPKEQSFLSLDGMIFYHNLKLFLVNLPFSNICPKLFKLHTFHITWPRWNFVF